MNRDFNLPPGVTRRDIDTRYEGEFEDILCRVCGEWFVPVDDVAMCDRCAEEVGDARPATSLPDQT